jgi:2-hydroxychromene-2-carboxylate isomerase
MVLVLRVTPRGPALPMTDTSPVVDFHFFVGSTYTYLSVHRIEAVAATAGIRVRWRPFFLRTILMETNSSPFIGKPAKLAYMWRDIERRAARHDLPFAGAPSYPVDPDGLANRVAFLASREGWCPEFTKAVYRDWFLRHQPPGDLARTHRLIAELGQDADAVIARANTDELRSGFDAETRLAAAMGIFGSPTFSVANEIFWGDDRLEDAIDWARRSGTALSPLQPERAPSAS